MEVKAHTGKNNGSRKEFGKVTKDVDVDDDSSAHGVPKYRSICYDGLRAKCRLTRKKGSPPI